jgi:hypothetical protein
MSAIIPLHPLVPLDPVAADAMGTAFDDAWTRLCASGERISAQETCDLRIKLAHVILRLGQRGERDPARLRDFALASLDEERLDPADRQRL